MASESPWATLEVETLYDLSSIHKIYKVCQNFVTYNESVTYSL
jgi:hypothetical protein